MSEERIVSYSRENLPKDDRTDWARIDAMTEEEINEAALSDPDAQPLNDEFFKRAKRITPPPETTGIRLYVDEDVLAWFRSNGEGYQKRMNAALRAYMEAQRSHE